LVLANTLAYWADKNIVAGEAEKMDGNFFLCHRFHFRHFLILEWTVEKSTASTNKTFFFRQSQKKFLKWRRDILSRNI
jgi:hypothetical protein